MNQSPASEGTTAPYSAGAWLTLYEDLLGGIIHSMNNAITVLAVSLELAAPGDASGELAPLRREIGQLEYLIGLTAALSSRSPRAEALEVRAVMDVALTIHALNPATRTVKSALRITGEVPPVRVPRTSLLRTLLMLVDGAKRSEQAAEGPVQIDVLGDPERVRVSAPFTSTNSDLEAFAQECGGALTVRDGSVTLELPSLQRLRRAGGTHAPRETIRPTRAAES